MDNDIKRLMDNKTNGLRFRPSTSYNGMTSQQKAVLRRKKAYIADMVTRTEELASEMKDQGLIDEETVKDLKDEKNPSQLVIHLIDAALCSSTAGAYDRFMALLSTRHQYLVDELRMELMYEQGACAVDAEVAKEASSLVHKKFGSSKRFGEGDKKDILDLLAVKIQLTNEEWQNRIQSTADRVKVLENTQNHRENKALEISRAVGNFVRDHDKRLITHSHDLATTTDILTTTDGNETLSDLKVVVDKLLFRMEQILNHRETLLAERSKSLQALRVKDDSVRLDKAIKDVTSTYNKQIKKLKQEVEKLSNDDKHPSTANENTSDDTDVLDLLEEKDSTIWGLKAKVTDLEKDNASTHRQIIELRQELDNTRTEMIALRRNNRALQMSLEGLKNKVQRENTVHFSDTANTVSIVELTALPSIVKKKGAGRATKRPGTAQKTLLKRPSTVH